MTRETTLPGSAPLASLRWIRTSLAFLSGSLPWCDTAWKASGTCVGCVTNADCGGLKCDAKNGRCVESVQHLRRGQVEIELGSRKRTVEVVPGEEQRIGECELGEGGRR